MYEEDDEPPFDRYAEVPLPEPDGFIERLQHWLSRQTKTALKLTLRILIPIIQVLVFLGLVCGISIIINIYLRRVMVPKALIHQQVFFDYAMDSPTAVVKFDSTMKQWEYLRYIEEDVLPRNGFLRTTQTYDIHCTITVAKSARNFDISTTPVTLKLVDSAGETVAKSSRAIIIPYQHPFSLLLESLAFFPWRALQYAQRAETVDVWIDLMRDYKEPGGTQPPAEAIELTLSQPVMDISYAYVTVMPQLRGIVYYMYYHPIKSFIVGCILTTIAQLGAYAFIAVVILAVRYVYQTFNAPSPLEAQYARFRRQRATHSTAAGPSTDAYASAQAYPVHAAASPASSSSHSSVYTAASAHAPLTTGIAGTRDTYQPNAGAGSGRPGPEVRTSAARQFVDAHILGGSTGGRGAARSGVGSAAADRTHLGGAASSGASGIGVRIGVGDEYDVSEELFTTGVIDTINAELLLSREQNRQATQQLASTAMSRSPEQHERAAPGRFQRFRPSPARTVPPSIDASYRNRANSGARRSNAVFEDSGLTTPTEDEDWDIVRAMRNAAQQEAPAGVGVGGRGVGVGSRAERPSPFAVSHPSAVPAGAAHDPTHHDHDSSSSPSHTPPSIPSSYVHSFAHSPEPVSSPESAPEDTDDEDPIDRVFRNDLMNVFFPYLRRKQPEGDDGGPAGSKKNR